VLAEDDTDFLQSRGVTFETHAEGEIVNLVISDYELPPGYDVTHADLLLRLPNGFPDARPDMFWLSPAVAFEGGAIPPGSEQREVYVERSWQRWSRHLSENDWRPGIDNLQSYLRFVRTNLQAGVPTTA
jgi:hypothetical protein